MKVTVYSVDRASLGSGWGSGRGYESHGTEDIPTLIDEGLTERYVPELGRWFYTGCDAAAVAACARAHSEAVHGDAARWLEIKPTVG